MNYFRQILEKTPHKSTAVRPLTYHLKNIQVRQTRYVGHCWRSKDEQISNILQWTPDEPVLANKQELIYKFFTDIG